MRPEIFTIAFGTGFVLLGRWLYRNPYRVFPRWGLLNPKNPKVQRVARLYATFFIFMGVLASGAVISFRFLPGHADLEIPISGPNGKATLYATARKSAGVWTFEVLQVEFAKDNERADLIGQVQKENSAGQ